MRELNQDSDLLGDTKKKDWNGWDMDHG